MRVGSFELQEPLPDLKDPHVIALLRPWVDVGSVGTIALKKLERHLGAKELGRLYRPGNFYDFTRYRPVMNVVEGQRSLNIPNTVIKYALRKGLPDLLFFHLLEPQAFAEDYIESVLDVVDTLGVKQYIRVGGMYDVVPHTRPLIMTGTAHGELVKQYSDFFQVRPSKYQGPTAILNLLADGINDRGIDAASLMVHLPQYVQLDEDYAGAARILEVLCSVYDLPMELTDSERGQRQYRELNYEVMRNQGLKSVVERLEVHYDSRSFQSNAEDLTKLSPEVEKFLKEMGERFEG